MSLVEVFDHGTPHPWANFRINNLTVDGAINTNGNTTVIDLVIPMFGAFLLTPFTYLFTKIGKKVIINIPEIQNSNPGGNNNDVIRSSIGAIPNDLLPDFSQTGTFVWPIRVINGVIPATPGNFFITNSGTISMLSSQGATGFQNFGTRGCFATTISYNTA